MRDYALLLPARGEVRQDCRWSLQMETAPGVGRDVGIPDSGFGLWDDDFENDDFGNHDFGNHDFGNYDEVQDGRARFF
jgi:hypothetical protein